ncbi:MAG: cupin domain-containing protein [Chitinivibrionales bacterium]|nr:cupin domain-containing protein [Chitinivibrionales bacterium]
MNPTSLLRRRTDMPRQVLSDCHGGAGDLDFTPLLDKASVQGRQVNFIHDDVLAPGASIGVHSHTHDEEYYLVLAGRGTIILDGARHEIGPGDIAAVYPGGSHGLENTGGVPLRLIVFSTG